VERSGYDHISHRSEKSGESVSDSTSHWNRVDSFSADSDAGQIEPEVENQFLAAWISRSDNDHEQAELQARWGGRKLNRVGKNSVESADSQDSEDPDNSKDTYGTTDVE